MLYGPSGVGKSSLLRAGVFVELASLARRASGVDRPEFIPVVFSAWQADPVSGLVDAIRRSALEYTQVEVAARGTVPAAVEAVAAATGVPLLIVLDQFEDYWTYQDPGARRSAGMANGSDSDRSLAEQLARAWNSDLPANFLISLREDSLAQLDRTFRRRVLRLLDHRLSLTPLNRAEAELAIRRPLDRYSELTAAEPPLRVEDALVEVVLDQVRVGRVSAGRSVRTAPSPRADDGDAIEAPYLQLVMRRIWESEHAAGSHVLRAETLDGFGGAERIVRTHVASALVDVGPTDLDAIADLLRYLVSPSNTKVAWSVDDLARFTRRPPSQVESLLAILADPRRRIIRPVADGTVPRYEIFHDVLAQPLLDWASRRELIRAEAERKRRVEAEVREERERRAKVRARRLVAALAIAVFAALIAIVVISLMDAASQRRGAQSEQLAARAGQISDPGLASLYALESYRVSPTEDARSAILQLASSHEIGRPLATRDGGINAVAWSPDGTLLATAGGDGELRIWNARLHRQVAEITPLPALAQLRDVPHLGVIGTSVDAVAFSPDGHHVAYGENVAYYNAPKGNRTVLGTVHLWDVQTHTQVATFAPMSRINALAFSPDGTRLAAGDGMVDTAKSDNAVRLWDVHKPTVVKILRGGGPVNSVAFDGRGDVLASSSCDFGDSDNHSDTGDHAVSLWNAHTGRAIASLRGSAPVCSVAFSPDRTQLAAAGDDKSVTLWNVARRKPSEPPLVGHTDVLNGVAFSPDGRILASAGRDHSIRIWDAATHRQLGAPLTGGGTVNAVAFSPSGTMLASAGADGVQIWNVDGPYDDGVLRTALRASDLSVAFSPDGRLLAWTDNVGHPASTEAYPDEVPSGTMIAGTVRIWDAKARRLLDVIRAPTDNVNSLAFAPDSRTLVWAANDQSVWVWSVWKHARTARIVVPNANGGTFIERVAISPDGRMIAFADMDGERSTIWLWSRESKRLRAIALGRTGGLGGLAFSSHGSLLASAGFDGKVRLFDVRTRRQVAALESRTSSGSTPTQYDVAFSPSGQTLASAGGDGSIMFWDVASRRELGAPLTQDTAAVYSVSFSADGKTLASGSLDGTVRLWDVPARRALLTLSGHTNYVFGVAFNRRQNTLASAGADGTVRLWSNISLQSAIARLCSYVSGPADERLWHRIEPSIGYRAPCVQ